MSPNALNHPLGPEPMAVLHAIAQSDLSTASTIDHQAGRSVLKELSTLVEQGYVREHVDRRRNGVTATLYSLTAEGERAIRAADAAATEPSVPTVETPRTASPSAGVYQGAELRPYTGRAGALDAFTHPSRMGDCLHHRDGSLTLVV
jgi:hypothetical protein